MGFLKKQRNETKEKITQYKIQSNDKTLTILISDINDKRTIKSCNPEPTKLVSARIEKTYSKKRKKVLISEDYIVFEIPEKQELTPQILETAVAEYEYEKQIYSNELIYYLGKYTTSKFGNYFQISLIENIIEEVISEMRKEIKQRKKEREIFKHREYTDSLRVKKSNPELEQNTKGDFDEKLEIQQEHDDI